MKKKLLATVLVLMLAIGLMSGCTTAEVGYLNLMKDSMNMKSAEVSGTVDIEVNLQEVAKTIDKLSGVNISDLDEALKAVGTTEKIKLKYDGKISMSNSFGYDLNMSVVYKGKTVEFGNMIFDVKKGMYISTDFLYGTFEIMNMFEESAEAKKTGEDILASLKKEIGAKYLQMATAADMTLPGVSSFEQLYAFGQPEVDLVTNAFKEFSTGKVTSTSDSFSIALTVNDMFAMVSSLLDYVANNEEAIIKAIETYAATGSAAKLGLTDEVVNKAIKSYKENGAAIKATLSTLKTSLDSLAKQQAVQEFSKSYYNLTTTKIANGLKGKEDLKIIANGVTLLSITADATTVAKDVTIISPTQNIMTMDAAIESYTKLVNAASVASSAAIQWKSTDEFVDVEYEMVKAVPYWAGNSSDFLELRMKDGSMYLPLRSISESFGEEVGWDNKTKKAYVMKDGKQVMMEGMLSHSEYEKSSLTFVKIRDFEKLGYKVDYVYDKETKMQKATLTK